MGKITLNEALKKASVKNDLQMFLGLDAQSELGGMTPERLAAVAGESMMLRTGEFKLDLVVSEVGIKAICEECIKRISSISKHTMFSMMVKCGNIVMISGFISYNNGFIRVSSYNSNLIVSFTISEGVLTENKKLI